MQLNLWWIDDDLNNKSRHSNFLHLAIHIHGMHACLCMTKSGITYE